MSNSLEFNYKLHYGKEYYYPQNQAAQLLVELCNRKKSVTKQDLAKFAQLLRLLDATATIDIEATREEAYDF